MSRYMLAAFSKPVEGREAEYNSWYNNVHMPEVLNVPGFSSAQRFKVQIPMVGEMPGRYLALYQMDADSPELDRAAVTIVGRIANVLKVGAQLNFQRVFLENPRAVVERPWELCPVVQLQYLLMTIVEPAITQQKPRPARCQIVPVGV